eukprot:TRINITY_DN3205_c0_g2_i1.p1 TRINITY_DN3205_c0_g2~~TRINITY_DN3205_c0_g2_i1.p1  ORF type:complete len:631 (+),score=125.13 TRINITY_DN3205_c0_g2_i1:183-2075(+)
MSAMAMATDFIMSVAYSLRVELVSLMVFGSLWIAGKLLSSQLNGPKGTKRKQISPPNSRASSPKPRGKSVDGTSDKHQDTLASDIDISAIDPSQLQDPSWLVPKVCSLSRSQVKRALELCRFAVKSGLNLKAMPEADSKQLFAALIPAVIRSGLAEDALSLLKDLQSKGHGIDLAIFTSATKLCTAKQLFAECLEIYDYVLSDVKLEICDKIVWSCLLFCAVETKAWSRCQHFFDQLKANGEPSAKDFSNMIRFCSSAGDWQQALSLLQDMRTLKIETDSVVYNTALGVLVSAHQVDQARALLDEMQDSGKVTDVVTYNTLAKGYIKESRLDACLELYEQMQKRGIAPSQVTYGIMLDGCINENRVEKAAEIFETMKKDGCAMNTVLYTTLIKGFARAGQIDQATKVFDEMRSERSIAPDLITFSILIKATCDAGRLEAALRLLMAMKGLSLRADEIVYNNLLGGCIKDSNTNLAKRLYADMVSDGIKPSNATFSIMIRLYAQCKMLDEAVELLRKEPPRHGVEPEARLFSQLTQSCLRERQGRRAVEVYKMLIAHSIPSAAMNGGLLSMCAKLNMLDTGAEILSLAATVKSRADSKDAAALMDAAVKKKKTQVVEVLRTTMMQMGIPVL